MQIVIENIYIDNQCLQYSFALVHPLFQLLPHFEKRRPLRSHLDQYPCLGIPSSVRPIFPHHEAAEASDLDPVTFDQGILEPIEDEVHDPGGLDFGQVILGCE